MSDLKIELKQILDRSTLYSYKFKQILFGKFDVLAELDKKKLIDILNDNERILKSAEVFLLNKEKEKFNKIKEQLKAPIENMMKILLKLKKRKVYKETKDQLKNINQNK